MNPPPAPQSCANVVPCDDTNGSVQPSRSLYASICASGMFDTFVHVTPLSASIPSPVAGTLPVNQVQPPQKSSGPMSMNWYTASCRRPSNRSSSVLGPSGVSNG